MRREIKRNDLKARLVGEALAIFILTEGLAVLGNGLAGKGFMLNRSISRYVGFGLWSSILFALGNVGVSYVIGKYLWRVGEIWRMPRMFYYLVVLMVVGLVGLSLCPLGLADLNGQLGVVSTLHQIFSRLMFFMMLCVTVMIMLNQQTRERVRKICMVFVTYGVICAVGSILHLEWFEAQVLIWETMFFFLFMLLLVTLPRGEKQIRGKMSEI